MPIRTPRMTALPLALALGTGITLLASLPASADALPSPMQALKQQGFTFHGQFEAPGGLEGYAASASGQTVAAYLTADGQHAVVGTLIDEQGNNVSADALQRLVNGPKNAKLWEQMADQHWVREGDADAERIVYTFSDPNCPYCRKFWEDARPWVESGRVQIRHLMVGVLKPDSAPKAAALLSADAPAEAIAEHYRTGTMPDIAGSTQSQRHVSAMSAPIPSSCKAQSFTRHPSSFTAMTRACTVSWALPRPISCVTSWVVKPPDANRGHANGKRNRTRMPTSSPSPDSSARLPPTRVTMASTIESPNPLPRG